MNTLTAKLENLKYAVPGPRYSILKVFIVYVMCQQFQISGEFFFRDGWIELVELHKKKYVSNLKKIFYEKNPRYHYFQI